MRNSIPNSKFLVVHSSLMIVNDPVTTDPKGKASIFVAQASDDRCNTPTPVLEKSDHGITDNCQLPTIDNRMKT